jgi:EmrB/QacA subfamily drug resistance transporter
MSSSVTTQAPNPIRPQAPAAGPDENNAASRRGLGITLAVVLVAQLMIILDMTVVNIALPRIADGLHLQAAGLSWVMNAYSLTFGGLLLLGGRAGDLLGRRRVFMAGIAVFTLASLAGGLATSAPMLLAARAVQGVGAAFATPATLATIVSSFPEGRPRTRALALFTGVITGGASLGLVLGGMITQWETWRWVFFINVPVGIAVILVAPRYLAASARRSGRFDLLGALTSTTGMAALVYAFIRAASSGWTNQLTLVAFAAAIVLLATFVFVEARTAQPVTPLRLFADRTRAGSYVARLLLIGGMFGMFFFLTQFVQNVLGFSPLQAGVSFLPMTAALFAVSRLAPRLIPLVGAKRLMLAGMLPAIAGLTWLAQISPSTTYLSGVLGPMLLVGTGMGLAFVPLTMASLAGVAPEDSGAASSMVNVSQQAGGALGLSILVTVYGHASRAAAAHAISGISPLAHLQYILAHAMASSFGAAAIFDALALLVIGAAIRFNRAAAPASR